MGIIKYNLRMSFAPTIIEAALAESIAVPNSMQFTQTSGFQYFIMDNSQTYGSPDPPQLNNTEMFTLGGIWNMPVTMSYVEFKCHLFGVLVYDEKFEDPEQIFPGFWSYSLPFDVPPVAPTTTYYVTVEAYDVNGAQMFAIDTDFRFA